MVLPLVIDQSSQSILYFLSAARASVKESTTTIFNSPPSIARRAIFASPLGTNIILAPEARAVMAFCATPPTGPTIPSGRIDPVTATRRPLVIFSGESSSMIANEKAKPADGPLTRSVSMRISTGNCHSLIVSANIPNYPMPSFSANLTETGSSSSSRRTINSTISPGAWA